MNSFSRHLLLLILILLPFNASASQTSVPFFECRGCTDAQMQQAALSEPGLGVRIVYNLSSAHIVKYNVYREAGCLNRPQESDEARGDVVDSKSSCNQNPTRVIDWMPVDTELLAPFAVMVELYHSNPILLATGKAEVNIRDVGYDPGNPPQRFDPYQVAYDRISGTAFRNFMEAATQFFNDHTYLSLSNNELSSLVYDGWAPLRNATITLSESPEVSLDLSRIQTDATVDFKDDNGAYVRIKFTHQESTNYTAEFVGAWDAAGAALPTDEEAHAAGFHRTYRGGRGGEAAYSMGIFLHNNGFGGDFFIPNPSCRIITLSCIAEPVPFASCRIDCKP
ncbi:MAG TPA: hypothetical protein VFN25_01030 [Dokdonella sp.]|uniref:hypothetical protein n=1 Tax=Dokdonella sp. TaxID=2291710 RepID=UPI002D7F3583|nr:hypothetical protein [Dokdonella sp.]HET9031464.1 hypothetical protein [Dokdonella sp.]